MALKINTNIQNDTGFVVESDQVGVNGSSLDEVVSGFVSDITTLNTNVVALESSKQDVTAVKTTLDSVLQTNTIYNLGQLTGNITLTLPQTTAGELIYLSFINTNHLVDIVLPQGDVITNLPRLNDNRFYEVMFMKLNNNIWSVASRGILNETS